MTDVDIKENRTKYVENHKRNVNTYKLDVPYRLLADMYGEGDLIINPSYQRIFRWELEQQSAFIESLLLDIPIPQIFVAELEGGSWELIDGLQRVSTFLAFRGNLEREKGADDQKNNFKLRELNILEDLNDVGYNELSRKLQLSIERVPCRVEVLRSGNSTRIKVDMFTRINRRGVQLSDQEFRNCISRIGNNAFAQMVEDLSMNKWFEKYVTIGIEQRKKKEDQEYVLRFLSMHDNFKKFKDEKPELSKFFTDYVESAIISEDYDIKERKKLFEKTFELISKSDIESPFRSKGERGKFTGLIYTGVLVSVSLNLKDFENDSKFTADHIKKVQDIHRHMVDKEGLSKISYTNRYVKFLERVFDDTRKRIAEKEGKGNV